MTPSTASQKKRKKSKATNPWSTPAMRQYRSIKDAHPECVLFFRMGDFYEMFDEDARIVSKAIGLSLTQRGNGIDMAGVPFHAAEGYIRKMVDHGFRIAVCEQLEDPATAKGIVKRGVTRIVTPGTLIDESLLEESASNLLAAVSSHEDNAVIATTEISTGTFECHACKLNRLSDFFERLNISEILVSEEDQIVINAATRMGISLTMRPPWIFDAQEGTNRLCKQFNVQTVEGFGLKNNDATCGVAGALLAYIQDTQAHENKITHLQPPKIEETNSFVLMDSTTIRSLEIEQTLRGHCVEGSLLGIMQQCKTPMGKRLLREWLCSPLAQKNAIEERQKVVDVLFENSELFNLIQTHLEQIQDIARIIGRVAMDRATPRDIVALGQSLNACNHLKQTLESDKAFVAFKNSLETFDNILNELSTAILFQCVEQPPAHLRAGGLFRNGVDRELDLARELQSDAGNWLANYQMKLMEETGINTLKVGFNKVFGYYIEVTHAQTNRVPNNFSRKQTLKNAERYITPELKEFEHKILNAESDAINREQVLFKLLCQTIVSHIEAISLTAHIVAKIDVLANFAYVANRYGYVKPKLTDKSTTNITNGRHPVLDRLLQSDFVPNDCILENGTLALITGPNMAGKSTFIRQIALITLLAHTGSYVPASAATIGMVDRIFTRVGASDELHAGQSTFMVEMVETANILNNATKKSLVILDEIGRGTSTLDGLSLAWAITEQLECRGCRTLFATHYHELTTLANQLDGVINWHVKIKEWKENIVFLYRIEPGKSDRSYGIHVAKIAGVPHKTVKRANEILNSLTVNTPQDKFSINKPIDNNDLFSSYESNPIVQEIKCLNIDAVSPLEAFEMLRDFNRRASDEDEH